MMLTDEKKFPHVPLPMICFPKKFLHQLLHVMHWHLSDGVVEVRATFGITPFDGGAAANRIILAQLFLWQF